MPTQERWYAGLSLGELEERRKDAETEIRSAVDAAKYAERDLTNAEQADLIASRQNLVDLDEEISKRQDEEEQRHNAAARERAAQLHRDLVSARGELSGPPSLTVSDTSLRSHAEAIREGRPFGTVETRAAVTAGSHMSSPGTWATSGGAAPRTLYAYAGMQTPDLTGMTASMPSYTIPAGAAGAAETATHGEYDSVTPENLTAVRYGRWSKVTAGVDAFDELSGIQYAHAAGIARDLDLACVSAVETAAGTPLAFVDAASVPSVVRQGILTAATAVNGLPTDCTLFGTPADLALLQDLDPVHADGVGSAVSAFAGARLYPTAAATAGQVTVFVGSAWTLFLSATRSATNIDPSDGSNTFGQWVHAAGPAPRITGGAVAIDVASA